MAVNSIKDLEKVISAAITNALRVEGAQAVKEALERSAEENVYNYPAKSYHRRYNLLKDQMYKSIVHGTTLSVAPIDPPNPVGDPPPTTNKDLPLLIETGGFGVAKINEMSEERRNRIEIQSGQVYDYVSMRSRPFVARARERLAGSNDLEKAIADGLRRQGINVV